MEEKEIFYNEMAGESSLESAGDLVLGLGNFNGHGGRTLMVLKAYMEEIVLV